MIDSKTAALWNKSESFKYIPRKGGLASCSIVQGSPYIRCSSTLKESTRQRVEREAMERMTRIYNCKTSQKYFTQITNEDVYGQALANFEIGLYKGEKK